MSHLEFAVMPNLVQHFYKIKMRYFVVLSQNM
jgi:hypothetical protein